MRRWFTVLLLVLMPLQFSWAALATYCEHESGAQAQHLGHHEHEHSPGQADLLGKESKSPLSATLDVEDCHFHCQCMAALPASMGLPSVIAASAIPVSKHAGATAPAPAPPERPQWLRHA